jgi:predicted nucleotidyltransferase
MMELGVKSDSVLLDIKQRLHESLDKNIIKIVLFGSRARGMQKKNQAMISF